MFVIGVGTWGRDGGIVLLLISVIVIVWYYYWYCISYCMEVCIVHTGQRRKREREISLMSTETARRGLDAARPTRPAAARSLMLRREGDGLRILDTVLRAYIQLGSCEMCLMCVG
jgi:hypothetical protein